MRRVSVDQAVAWLRSDAPVLVVCGAGLSIPWPASVPRVSLFLKPVLEAIEARAGLEVGPDIVRRALPESIYGALAECSGSFEHLKVWELLARERCEARGSRPNSGHALVAQLASRRGSCLVTTNFDEYVEWTADELRIPTQVVVPQLGRERLRSQAGVLNLLKIHGSASDARTVCSTSASLSRAADHLNACMPDELPERLLVVGYSARDFDLSPWLFERYAGGDVLWVDVDFPADHAARFFDSPGFEGSWEELAARIVGAPRVPATRSPEELETSFGGELSHAVETFVEPLLRRREVGVATLVNVLASAAAHAEATELEVVVRTLDDEDLRSSSLLWIGESMYALDRFMDAEKTARLVAGSARRNRHRWLYYRAVLLRSWARTTTYALRVPGVRAARAPMRDRMALAKAMAGDIGLAVAGLPILAFSMMNSRKATWSSNSEFSATCEYLEHLVRVLWNLPFLGKRDGLWRMLGLACTSIGYSRGIINVERYRARLSGSRPRLTTSYRLAGITGDLTAQAIILRDQLSRAVDARLPDGELLEAYDNAVRLARPSGSPSLLLKVYAIAARSGLGSTYGTDEVQQLISGCQSHVVARQRHGLLQLLTKPSQP
jgi:hypothetical protein